MDLLWQHTDGTLALWKMNGLKASASELGQMIAGANGPAQKADLLICPPATLVLAFAGAVQVAGRVEQAAGRIRKVRNRTR